MAKRQRKYSLFGTTQIGNEDASVSVKPVTASVGANVGFGDENRFDLSVGVNPQGVGISPKVRFGDDPGNRAGASIGGTVGTVGGAAFGGPIGSAAGSLIGSAVGSIAGGAFGGKSQGSKETDRREGVINAYTQGGLFDKEGNLVLADGTIFNAHQGSKDGQHAWKYQDKRADKVGDRPLFNYEIDYTNDLDYLSGMAGVSLSRVLSGGTNKEIDQVGGMLGNAFLGKSGYGAELTQDSFNNVITNARSAYAKKGIDSKEEFLALANKMFSEGRIKDSDYAVMNQTATMVFDKDFNTATKLMSGRNKGIETASSSPSDANATMTPQNQPGRIYSPVISPQEAMLSVAPYLEQYKAAKGKNPKGASNTASGLSQAAGVITALAGTLTDKDGKPSGLGSLVSSGIGAIRDFIMGDDSEGIIDDIGDLAGDFTSSLEDFSSEFGLA